MEVILNKERERRKERSWFDHQREQLSRIVGGLKKLSKMRNLWLVCKVRENTWDMTTKPPTAIMTMNIIPETTASQRAPTVVVAVGVQAVAAVAAVATSYSRWTTEMSFRYPWQIRSITSLRKHNNSNNDDDDDYDNNGEILFMRRNIRPLQRVALSA